VGSGERGACTLLGPEGPDAASTGWWGWVFFPLGLLVAGFGWCAGGCRPYFENYTVDASIFKMTFRGCLV
jgi:hypothetical protein